MNYSFQLRNASTWGLVALQGIELSTKGVGVVFQVLGESSHFVAGACLTASAWAHRKAADIRPDGKPLTMPGATGGSMKDDDIVTAPTQGHTVPDEFNRDIDVEEIPPDDTTQDTGTIIDDPPETSVAETVETKAVVVDSSEEQDTSNEKTEEQAGTRELDSVAHQLS